MTISKIFFKATGKYFKFIQLYQKKSSPYNLRLINKFSCDFYEEEIHYNFEKIAGQQFN